MPLLRTSAAEETQDVGGDGFEHDRLADDQADRDQA